MIEDQITFTSAGYMLEGMLSKFKHSGKYPVVVVCHPHPNYGGDMDNDLVYSICNSLNQRSILTLRFNFPGVCGSEGIIKPESVDNIEDILNAIDYMV
ncbi:MAG: hypothetical protein NTV30_05630, partial [Chloroflexi bacterium]|nr:hypothetical protein [Chloroflexota bacterium]